jgi:flagellin-specific chaperone FliS
MIMKIAMKEFTKTFSEIYPYKFRYLVPSAHAPSEQELDTARDQMNEVCMDAWMSVVEECAI